MWGVLTPFIWLFEGISLLRPLVIMKSIGCVVKELWLSRVS